MIVKGIVTGIIRDSETGKFKRSFTVENDITDYWLDQMANAPNTYSGYIFGPNIFISAEENTIKAPRSTYVYDVYEVGFVEAGVTSPTWTYPPADTGSPKQKTPPYIQFQQRFNPPTADRKITIVGLTADTNGSTNIGTYKRTLAQAWVTLTPSCTQLTTETLDIFYRVQFLYEYEIIEPDEINPPVDTPGIEKYLAYRAAIRYAKDLEYAFFYRPSLIWSGSKVNNRKFRYSYNLPSHDTYSTTSPYYSTSIYTDIKKTDLTMYFDISAELGKLIGAIGYGDKINTTNSSAFTTAVRDMINLSSGDTPIQNIFGHAPTATKPFYDSTEVHSGTGKMSVDGSGWTNPDWPKLYRLDITSGGATGTATYKLKIRNHFGFHQNAYRDQERSMIFMFNQHNISRFEGFNIGLESLVFLNYKYSGPWDVLAVGKDELCVINTTTQTGKRIHSSLQPNFTATQIGNVVIEKATGDVWVACRSTGLYKITDPANTRVVNKITLPSAGSPQTLDRCISVALTPVPGTGGTGKRVWAIFSDSVGDMAANSEIGLYYSDDDGVTWTQDTTWNPSVGTYWDGGYVNSMGNMIGDQNHPDGRLMIQYRRYPASTSLTYDYVETFWHDGISGTVAGPYVLYLSVTTKYKYNLYYGLDDPRTFMHFYDVSDNGIWGGFYNSQNSSGTYPRFLTYGSTTVTQSANVTENVVMFGFAKDDLGNDAIIYTRYLSPDVYFGIFKNDGTYIEEKVIASDQDFGDDNGVRFGGLVYLGKGIILGRGRNTTTSYYTIATLSPSDKPDGHVVKDLDVWTEYGWDGVNWVENNTNSKTTHTTSEQLIDGVSISFSDDPTNVGGTNNWIANDYYTFGVVDGVWLDGSTEVTHRIPLYFKNAIPGKTEIEAATLPTATKSIDYLGGIPSYTYTNDSGITIANNGRDVYDGSFVLDSFSNYAQSNEYIAATAVGLDNNKEIKAAMYFYLYNGGISNANRQFVLGFSTRTRINNIANYEPLGTTPREESPEFAIRIDPATNGLADYIDISVVHSGIEQARINNFYYTENTLGNSVYFRIVIKKNGHIRYSYFHGSHGEKVLYDTESGSPIPTPPITTHEDYFVDWVSSGGTYSGFKNLWVYGPTDPDYYITLGTQTNGTGYWNPDYYSLDYNLGFEITIDNGAVTPVNIGNNDTTTVLASGEYSIFPRTGAIRYSSADAGKAISVKYTEITNK